jgi:hypothetical protein
LVAVLANFMAHQRASCCAPDSAYRPAKDGVASHATDHGTDARADLGVAGIGSATTQGKGCSASGGEEDVTDFHGKSPL